MSKLLLKRLLKTLTKIKLEFPFKFQYTESMKNKNITEADILNTLEEAYKKAIKDLAKLYVKNGEIEDLLEARDNAQEYLDELIHNGDLLAQDEVEEDED